MKKKIIIVSIVCSLAVPVTAQLRTDSLQSHSSQVAKNDLGDLLVTLAGAIKPDSYKTDFQIARAGFISRSKAATDASSIAANITEFIAYIKPEKFRKDVIVENLISKGKAASTMSQSADLLKVVEESIKKEAISSMWSLSKEGWKKEVKQLQQSTK